jgi:hypothetical protein
MTTRPCLELDGDAIEQKTWPEIKPFFPHYEEFWRQHLYPLRAPGTVQPRQGLDEQFELLAMNHYSVYVSLTRADAKLASAADLLFPDEIYWNLFRACELAAKVIWLFSDICSNCGAGRPPINQKPLNRARERICHYRHLIHRPIQAIGTDASARPLIPRHDKLNQYDLWSKTLYGPGVAADYVDAGQQLKKDFEDLCAALEIAWTGMCEFSKQLVTNSDYLKRRDVGKPSPVKSKISDDGSIEVKIKLPPAASPSVGTLVSAVLSSSTAAAVSVSASGAHVLLVRGDSTLPEDPATDVTS